MNQLPLRADRTRPVTTDRIAEFQDAYDALDFQRMKGREYTVCAGLRMPWAVRPLSDEELSINEEVTARVRDHDRYLEHA